MLVFGAKYNSIVGFRQIEETFSNVDVEISTIFTIDERRIKELEKKNYLFQELEEDLEDVQKEVYKDYKINVILSRDYMGVGLQAFGKIDSISIVENEIIKTTIYEALCSEDNKLFNDVKKSLKSVHYFY